MTNLSKIIKYIFYVCLLFVSHSSFARLNTSTIQIVQEKPIKRVILNFKNKLKTEPDDKSLRLYLARAYVMAYFVDIDGTMTVVELKKNISSFYVINKTSKNISKSISKNEPNNLIIDDNWDFIVQSKAIGPKKYLKLAIEQYKKADIDSTDFKNLLGYSWCLIQNNELTSAKKILMQIIDNSMSEKFRPQRSQNSLVIEAVNYLIPLFNKKKEKDKIEKYSKLKYLRPESNYKHNYFITPLIISIDGELDIEKLVNKKSDVKFNLDVSTPKRWGWVKPTVGILYYDVTGEKTELSGIDLFGSFSFFIFFKNGFDALASLDDNHNGIIENKELDHIYIWFDKNQNGLIENDERFSVKNLNIIGLKTNYELQNKQILNPSGVILKNGQTLPIIDWQAKSPHDL